MNFKKNLLVFSILICLFFCISSVSAGDVNDTTVNAYENQVIGDEVIASSQDDLIQKKGSGTFTELQAIIDNASVGSTISLDRDYNYDKEFNSTNGIVINKNLTINGNGHTLNGLSKSRILYIDFRFNENNKVFLKHINFKNGNTSNYGGAILNFADLSIDKCDFRYNYADITAGAVCSLGSLTCKNSNFYKNTANGDAGAIFSFNSNISKSWLRNVSGIHSLDDLRNFIFGVLMGQIKVTPLTDYIKNCKFTGNVALGRGGGAIYALTHISIHSSTFKSNKADEMGGAVYGAKNILIKNSKFSDNKVSKYGGAVYFKCHDLTSNYENGKWVNHVKFYHCLIENSVFENNVAKKAGGAIYGFKYASNMKKPGAQARKCTFKDNIASLGNEIHGGTAKDCKYKNTLTLKAATIKKSAKKLVLSATVKKDSKPEKGKKVTFTFNGITYTAKTDSKGVAKVTVPSKILKKLKVGKTVEYSAKFYKFTDRKSGKVSK